MGNCIDTKHQKDVTECWVGDNRTIHEKTWGLTLRIEVRRPTVFELLWFEKKFVILLEIIIFQQNSLHELSRTVEIGEYSFKKYQKSFGLFIGQLVDSH